VTEDSESLKSDEFLTVRSTEGEWKEFSDGVMIKQLYVNQARSTMTFLLRVSAGASVPAHRHPSIEEIFVIEGNCRVNSEILAPGDYRCAPPGSIDRVLTSELGATVLVVGPIDCELL
jgi:anti-sigma factor ChrR (cupin superfamily)